MEQIYRKVGIVPSLHIVIFLIALAARKPEEASAKQITTIESRNGESLNKDRTLPAANKYFTVNNSTIQDTIALDCGGIITLPPVGSSVLLDYKGAVAYGNNERCIWTLNNRIGSYRVKPSVQITMLVNGFESNADVLNVFYWRKGLAFASRTLVTSVPISIDAEAIFFSFHSDGTVTGTGFVVRIELFAAPAFSIYGSHYFYSSSSGGNSTYGPYGNDEASTVVVNPPASSTTIFTFSISRLSIAADSFCYKDYLEVVEIINGTPIRRAKLCGELVQAASSFRTNYPVLALFSSDASITGGGFTLSW